jgi:hypothetical protein
VQELAARAETHPVIRWLMTEAGVGAELEIFVPAPNA